MNDPFALAKFFRRSCHYMVLTPPPLARILEGKFFVGKFREIHPPERNGPGTPLLNALIFGYLLSTYWFTAPGVSVINEIS